MRLGVVVVQKKVVLVAAAIVVVVGASIGVLVSRQTLPGTVTAGPLHDAHEGVATGLGVKPSGIWTAVVEATFDGHKAARVTDLKLLPVQGFPTPKLVSTGYVTNSTVGSIMGRPKHDIRFERLLNATIRPTDNHLPHMAGIMVILQAGQKPGTYAIEGVQVEYTIGSTKHRSRLYTAATACVPPAGKKTCPKSVSDKVYNRMVEDSGD